MKFSFGIIGLLIAFNSFSQEGVSFKTQENMMNFALKKVKDTCSDGLLNFHTNTQLIESFEKLESQADGRSYKKLSFLPKLIGSATCSSAAGTVVTVWVVTASTSLTGKESYSMARSMSFDKNLRGLSK